MAEKYSRPINDLSGIRVRNMWFKMAMPRMPRMLVKCFVKNVPFWSFFPDAFFLTFWFEFSRPPLVLFMSCGDACRSGPNSNEGSDSQRMARAPILIILCVLRLYTVYIGPNTLHIFVLEEETSFLLCIAKWSDGQMVKLQNGQIAKWSDGKMVKW